MAFTFGNSSARFENVRNVMVEESNAVRTVIMRIDAFPDSLKDGYQSDMRAYLELRMTFLNRLEDIDGIMASKAKVLNIYRSMWQRTVKASDLPDLGMPTMNMFNALTALMDNASKRDSLLLAGIPEPIQYILFFLALTISFIGGFTTPEMKIKEWLVIIGFAFLATCIIFIALDLGRPMRGIIKPDLGETRLLELEQMLGDTIP